MKAWAFLIAPRIVAVFPGSDNPSLAIDGPAGRVWIFEELIITGLLLETRRHLRHYAVLYPQIRKTLVSAVAEPHLHSHGFFCRFDLHAECDFVRKNPLDIQRPIGLPFPFQFWQDDAFAGPDCVDVCMSQVSQA